jgi:roadblock/LC7 domain-containing protein
MLNADGKVEELHGLDPDLAVETGHFVASVSMMAETLLSVWGDMVDLQVSPFRVWLVQGGDYWLIGAGRQAWVLAVEGADIQAALLKVADLTTVG